MTRFDAQPTSHSRSSRCGFSLPVDCKAAIVIENDSGLSQLRALLQAGRKAIERADGTRVLPRHCGVKNLAEGASIVRYGPIAQGFHWITALLVLAAFLISAGGPERIVYLPERSGQLLTHELWGCLCSR